MLVCIGVGVALVFGMVLGFGLVVEVACALVLSCVLGLALSVFGRSGVFRVGLGLALVVRIDLSAVHFQHTRPNMHTLFADDMHFRYANGIYVFDMHV